MAVAEFADMFDASKEIRSDRTLLTGIMNEAFKGTREGADAAAYPVRKAA